MKSFLSKYLPFLKPESLSENLELEENQTSDSGSFKLSYKSLIIGKLVFEDGKWSFFYTEDFKNQTQLKTISDFPDIDKNYQEEVLWPFFASRIPTKNQPMVLDAISQNLISSFDDLTMLEKFGKKTITNPFILEMASA
jgi:HipA-like protein